MDTRVASYSWCRPMFVPFFAGLFCLKGENYLYIDRNRHLKTLCPPCLLVRLAAHLTT